MYLRQFLTYRTEVVKLRVVLVQNPDPNVNVWQLADYDVSYALSVLGGQQANIDSHLSAIKFFAVCRARPSCIHDTP